jgi:hypothetical protein
MHNKIQAGNSENLTNRGRGRPKGAINKATKTFRDTVNALLEGNADNVAKWLLQVAEGIPEHDIKPDPGKALDNIAKLAEFAAPKLARTEHATDPDNPLQAIMKIERVIIDKNSKD